VIFTKMMVGAIGLEPTTLAMSIVQIAVRSFGINILRYSALGRNDRKCQKASDHLAELKRRVFGVELPPE
ncbi:MAG: hypothetical protein ABI654_11710, partial [Betaproteobacteria bacterium]